MPLSFRKWFNLPHKQQRGEQKETEQNDQVAKLARQLFSACKSSDPDEPLKTIRHLRAADKSPSDIVNALKYLEPSPSFTYGSPDTHYSALGVSIVMNKFRLWEWIMRQSWLEKPSIAKCITAQTQTKNLTPLTQALWNNKYQVFQCIASHFEHTATNELLVDVCTRDIRYLYATLSMTDPHAMESVFPHLGHCQSDVLQFSLLLYQFAGDASLANVQDSDGNTPLHFVMREEGVDRERMAKMGLLRCFGANPRVTNCDGLPAMADRELEECFSRVQERECVRRVVNDLCKEIFRLSNKFERSECSNAIIRRNERIVEARLEAESQRQRQNIAFQDEEISRLRHLVNELEKGKEELHQSIKKNEKKLKKCQKKLADQTKEWNDRQQISVSFRSLASEEFARWFSIEFVGTQLVSYLGVFQSTHLDDIELWMNQSDEQANDLRLFETIGVVCSSQRRVIIEQMREYEGTLDYLCIHGLKLSDGLGVAQSLSRAFGGVKRVDQVTWVKVTKRFLMEQCQDVVGLDDVIKLVDFARAIAESLIEPGAGSLEGRQASEEQREGAVTMY